MTDRDFKLLVRRYFDLMESYPRLVKTDKDREQYNQLEKVIRGQLRKELARFTQQEIEELPFTTNDNEK